MPEYLDSLKYWTTFANKKNMNLEKKMQRMIEKVNSAVSNYYLAVEENLKELGHPVSLYNYNGIGVNIKLADEKIIKGYIFDQIKYDLEKEEICVHQAQCDDIITDEWISISLLCEQKEKIYQAILWLTNEDLVPVDGDTHSGTANQVWSFSSHSLYFIHSNGRIDCVDWHVEGIDYFVNLNGEFAVHQYEWSDAMREIDEHEDELEEDDYS